IEVKDEQDQPVLGATVRVYLPGPARREVYNARTYANGQALFFPLALADVPLAQIDRFVVAVEKDNWRDEFTLTRFEAQAAFSERWTVTLDTRRPVDSLNLDVLFLIDATGSMADEIAKIQDTIFDVAAQIDALPGRPNVRYGMVTYRDRGDEFVTRTYEFTPDVGDFHANLSTVRADGGGDTPESLNEALHQALHGVEWGGGDTVQLVFLVADAPPHLDYPQDYDYAAEMAVAASRGIKIFPIASSGLDDQGEYIYRQIAQFTQGRFIFLTYEGPTNGGAPGEATTHHVEDYSVANLDDLLVKLVEEELAYQTPQLAQGQY
ncbi:MAG: vWA domain-containing protein, partial [Chloroflexota bacterium]